MSFFNDIFELNLLLKFEDIIQYLNLEIIS